MIVFASKSRRRSSWWPPILAIGVIVLLLAMSSCEAARRAPALAHKDARHGQGVMP